MDELIQRHSANPILTARDWPYTANAVFNPGAVRLATGETALLCRVEDRRGVSHLTVARSRDGVTDWQIESTPALRPQPDIRPEECYGVEDPRVVFIPELDRFAVTYTSYGPDGPGVSLALTPDFKAFESYGQVLRPDDKDAALLPHRIDGLWAMIHRPITPPKSGHIWLSFSPDLKHWGGRRVMMRTRAGGWWDSEKIGLGPPPLETDAGWLMMYHGVKLTAAGAIYRVGAALLDRDDPARVTSRGRGWLLSPDAACERTGDVGNVVFPCGWVTADDGDTVRIYYGAADTSIGMATARISALIAWLKCEKA